MTVRAIQGHLAELYGTEVSPDLISKVTDAVHEEVRGWQHRPLETVYPIVFFDALRVKIRDEGMVRNKAVYVALGYTAAGEKDVLGIWIEQTEGAKFWLKVMNELKVRGVNDILVAVVDGLKGFPEAITTVFPQTTVQTCIVHLIRNSLSFVTWKDRKKVMPSVKAIYSAENAQAAAGRLEDFEAEWGTPPARSQPCPPGQSFPLHPPHKHWTVSKTRRSRHNASWSSLDDAWSRPTPDSAVDDTITLRDDCPARLCQSYPVTPSELALPLSAWSKYSLRLAQADGLPFFPARGGGRGLVRLFPIPL
jgi:hypothetical protein